MLTQLAIDKAKPSGKEFTLWDSAVPNFGVRITPNGAKSFVWVGYVQGKKTRRTIGRYPSKTLQNARSEALALIMGKDTQKHSCAFLEAFNAFKSLFLPTIAPSTAREWSRLLTKHFSTLPDLETLTVRQVSQITETLPPSEANHAVVALKRMLSWLRQTGRLHNHIVLTKPNKEKSRERVLSLDEIRRVWISTSTPNTFNYIVRLLVLTGQRRGEIATVHLCHLTTNTLEALDLHGCGKTTQTVLMKEYSSSSVRKTKPELPNIQLNSTNNQNSTNIITWPTTKNGKPHTIPLTPLATSYAHLVSKLSTAHNTWSKPMRAMYRAANVQGATLHDIRRSVATHMAETLKIAPHVIERILNHTPKGVASIYNRATYMDEMRYALDKWERLVLSLDSPRD